MAMKCLYISQINKCIISEKICKGDNNCPFKNRPTKLNSHLEKCKHTLLVLKKDKYKITEKLLNKGYLKYEGDRRYKKSDLILFNKLKIDKRIKRDALDKIFQESGLIRIIRRLERDVYTLCSYMCKNIIVITDVICEQCKTK